MRARCGLGEGRNLSNGSPPIGGSIQNEDAKPDAKFYPPFPSPPRPLLKPRKVGRVYFKIWRRPLHDKIF